jgi:hypothetical protein
MKCHICGGDVLYPDGVHSRGGRRIYHKQCIRDARASLIHSKDTNQKCKKAGATRP